MTKIKISLLATAFILGIGGALATTQAEATYRILSTNDVVDEDTANDLCPETQTECAVQISGPAPGTFLYINE